MKRPSAASRRRPARALCRSRLEIVGRFSAVRLRSLIEHSHENCLAGELGKGEPKLQNAKGNSRLSGRFPLYCSTWEKRTRLGVSSALVASLVSTGPRCENEYLQWQTKAGRSPSFKPLPFGTCDCAGWLVCQCAGSLGRCR